MGTGVNAQSTQTLIVICVELRITAKAISDRRTFHMKVPSQRTVAMNTFSGVLKDQNANAETSSNAKLS